MVAGDTRNAEAIVAAFSPSTTCKMSGARTPDSMAGCAGEHQGETVVRNGRIVLRGAECFGSKLQLSDRHLVGAPVPGQVDDFSASHSKQPRFRVRGATIQRPVDKCRHERIRQRIFSRRQVSGACRKEGDELAVAAPRDCVGHAASLPVAPLS